MSKRQPGFWPGIVQLSTVSQVSQRVALGYCGPSQDACETLFKMSLKLPMMYALSPPLVRGYGKISSPCSGGPSQISVRGLAGTAPERYGHMSIESGRGSPATAAVSSVMFPPARPTTKVAHQSLETDPRMC